MLWITGKLDSLLVKLHCDIGEERQGSTDLDTMSTGFGGLVQGVHVDPM